MGHREMIARIVMLSVICLMTVASVQAEPAVFFRGKQLTHRHLVYGAVTSCAIRAGTINLGYAHGLQQDQMVGVLRRSGGNLFPVGLMKLTEVRSGESFGTYEGAFSLEQDDIVIVSAKQLNLWRGGTRSRQLVIKSILFRGERGYDTGDVSPGLLNEVGRDDDLISHKSPPLHVNADVYSTQRPFVHQVEVRGAFRLATGDQDGFVNSLSKEDRELASNSAVRSLETGLAKFVASSADGKLTVEDETLRDMVRQLPGDVDLDDVTAEIQRANARVYAQIRLQ